MKNNLGQLSRSNTAGLTVQTKSTPNSQCSKTLSATSITHKSKPFMYSVYRKSLPNTILTGSTMNHRPVTILAAKNQKLKKQPVSHKQPHFHHHHSH